MTNIKKDKSYFSIERNRRKRNILIVIPVAVVVSAVVIGLFFMSGSSITGNQMVLHNHVRFNVTVDGQPLVVPAHMWMRLNEHIGRVIIHSSI